ncbi:MAG: ABC transporter substrate-binding protein [Treponema sp.]|jgi:ABC-type Fe3+ transport system substrate-binding protein|nr:ABC transporter substrate-binding protein [Treponema sp.]
MKKFRMIEKIPDSMRENLDFLGQANCPIKDRFSRAWEEFAATYNAGHQTQIRGVVPMGGCGTDIYCNISTVTDRKKFPQVVTDTGYQEFFTGNFLSSPEKLGWFGSPVRNDTVHPLCRGHSLSDPRGIFHVFGAMPHVILVNHRRLGGRAVPRRVADLTSAQYSGSLGTGFAEDDITELLLLEIWKEQGRAGIRALARNIGFAGRRQDMASDAVAHRDGCCVYLMSWFLAHAVPRRDYLEIIWPEDGAILNPLYALFKKPETAREDEVQEACASFLFGRELGQSLADGWFAHVHPEIRYGLPPDAKFRWVGWDYILEKPLASRVREIEKVYYDERRRDISIAS